MAYTISKSLTERIVLINSCTQVEWQLSRTPANKSTAAHLKKDGFSAKAADFSGNGMLSLNKRVAHNFIIALLSIGSQSLFIGEQFSSTLTFKLFSERSSPGSKKDRNFILINQYQKVIHALPVTREFSFPLSLSACL